MARKYELITELYNQTVKQICRNQGEWREFLRSSCYNYKLTFSEQVLVYAQRPNATAVLELEKWNKQFGRWVNKGATGIAVFDDEHNGNNRLKYYFDISDTHESRMSRPVPIWNVHEQYEDDIIETLENTFGTLEYRDDLPTALIYAASNAVEDNFSDYLSELMYCREDSFLEELDELNVEKYFKEALECSVSYMLLERCCDGAADDYAHLVDFSSVTNFNTRETLNALGTATSDISEMALREISATVRNLQIAEKKQIRTFAEKSKVQYPNDTKNISNSERSFDNGNHIQQERRLQHSQSGSTAGNTGNSPWEIRIETESVSQTEPQGDFHKSSDIGQTERASHGNRADGNEPNGTDSIRDGTGTGRDRTDESNRPNEVGRLDEQHSPFSGGNSVDGTYLQLKLFPTVEEQINNIEKAEEIAPSAFSLSVGQQIIDEVLCSGSNKKDCALRICSFYKKNKTAAENAAFLKSEYGTGGKGFIFDGEQFSVWFNKNGIVIANGDTALNAHESTLVTWEQADKRIRELLDLGRYMPQSEIDKTDANERKDLSATLWYLHQDRSGEFFMDEELFKSGFPNDTAHIVEMLTEPEELNKIINGLQAFTDAYEQDPSLLRFHFHKPKELLQRLRDLQLDPIEFTANNPISSASPRFITQDELDYELTFGNRESDKKYRIYFFFNETHSTQEKVAFIKNEYSNGMNNKGLTVSRGDMFEPHNSVVLTWAKVTKRIDELIADDKYLSENDKAKIPDYLERLENSNIKINKQRFIDSVANLPPAEKRDTLPLRLSDFLNYLENYEKNYLDKNDLSELRDTNAEQIATLLQNPLKTGQLITALANIQGATCGVFERNNACNFGAELKELHPRRHVYHLGDTVYIGSSEYEVMAYDDETVRLFDTSMPLINKEMPREEFDRKISENPANDHLLQTVVDEQETTQETEKTAEASETPLAVGTKLTIDDRDFIIDSIDEEFDKVSLQDITFQSATGFPIFRSESIEFVRDCIEVQKDHENLKQQVTDFLDRAGYAVSEELIDNGMEEYRARGGRGTYEDIGDFIEDNYLSDEPEPDISDITDELPTEKETITPTPAFIKTKSNSRIQTFDLHPEIPQADRHNFRITDDALGVGSAKEKFRNNINAIKTLQTIELDNRYATPEEQEILSKYVGWGGLSDAFDESKSAWADEFIELYTLLSPEEYTAARESSLTAFYTPPIVIKAMYKTLENMGFKSGNALEPSCAVGNFMGLVPESMQDCKFYGSEIDSISGRIAQQLYQKNNIAVQGYEKTNLPDSFFDLAIGNVPFGQFKVADKRYDKQNFLIHDYFFARTLDKVRPGGVVAFITSKGTLDKANSKVRKYIAQRADLLGAIRLPDNTFKANAGTEVTSDIIFLQKRDRIVDIEPDWVHLGEDENGISMNSYFVEHPEMVLGNMEMVSTAYGYDSACKADPDAVLSEQLEEAIQNIHAEITEYEFEDLDDEQDNSIPADPTVRNFSYALITLSEEQDNVTGEHHARKIGIGNLYYRENSRMFPVDVTMTAANRIKGMVEIRDCVRTLIEYQTEDYPDSDINAEQVKLNRLYDTFTKKYGIINSRANSTSFSNDSSYCLLCSLEVLDENGELQRKADMFSKRTIKAHSVVTSVDTASEALAVSLAEKACVDIGFMASLMSGSEKAEQIITDLQGVIFRNPVKSSDDLYTGWETADEYLSGNIREKLKTAQIYAESHPEYAVNVQSLEAVMPADLTASEISVRLGATWLPPEMIQQFMFELLSTPRYNQWDIKVHYSKFTAQWNIEGKSRDRGNVKAIKAFGTDRINAYKIIEETLNLKDVRIFDTVEDAEGNKKQVLNKKETTIAQQKQEVIKSAFAEWIWKDPERRNKLVRMYNDLFNSTRPREYDGSHISFNGINPEITLRPHQKNAVARTMYGGNTLNAHVVGAGKTFTMVAAAQESKRLGLCNKSLFVVPNHLTEQWASDYLQLYPSANILVATKKDFETKNRKKFCGRIATGDYDAVIIGHTQFEKVPMSIERQRAILEGQLDEILDGIAELKSSKAERFTVKQYEKTRKSVQLKLDKLNDQSRKDDVVTFEELGVDRVFIDEAHYYKNLFLYTKMRNVGGIAQTEAQKSSDLFMKCRYLDELTGGKGVIFATGTPISNSMVELYTMQRYLQYNTLVRHGLQHFDAWASTFGETVTAIELAPEGTGYRAKTRFAKFYNLPELMNMFREVADIQTADMLNLPVPKANYHNIAVKPSEFQKNLVAELSDRADDVRNKRVDPSSDNMLKITNDGRKLALDQRLINDMLPDDETGKAAICAENVYDIWASKDKITQLIFCDLSTPHYDGKFNVYDDLKKKLIAKGIPDEQIAFIHDAKNETQKKEMFAKTRMGQTRVLIGSTPKMGAGTNVQDKLKATHNIDCPWRPSDLEQRAGRIIRQGNENPEVDVFSYVTEGTFDAYLYQLVENKQKFIAQIMTSKSPVRSAEDIDEMALSYAEIKALATGNPYIKEKMDLDMQVAKLRVIKSSYLDNKYALEDAVLKQYPQQIKILEERIAGYKADMAQLETNTHPNEDKFSPMTVGDKTYTDKGEAGNAILALFETKSSPAPEVIGSYRGFTMELSFDREWIITLKNQLSHKVSLGKDNFGNITRLDNAFDTFPTKLVGCEETLANTKTQMENAKTEAAKPFPQEQEYKEKSARLEELGVLLNMDEKDSELIDGEPDEENAEPERKDKGRER